MCLCYQSPVHVYDADRSIQQNINENLSRRISYFCEDIYQSIWPDPKVINVGASVTPQNRFGFSDCSCSPDFMGSMFGIVPTNAGTWMALLSMALLLGIPFAIGLAKNVRSSLSIYALCVWLIIHAVGFIEGYMRLSQYRDAGGLQSYWVHIPLQLVFNLLVMIVVPAATIRLLQRFFARQ